MVKSKPAKDAPASNGKSNGSAATAAARRGKKGGSSSLLMYGAAFIALASVMGAVLFKDRGNPSTLRPPPENSKVPERGRSVPERQDAAEKVMPSTSSLSAQCADDNTACEAWAAAGECAANPGYMKTSCKASCGICDGSGIPKARGNCKDSNVNCATWASIGECESNPSFMKTQCPVTCRLCQSDDCHDKLLDCADRVRGSAASNFSNTGCYTIPNMREQCAWTCVACGLKPVPRCRRLPGSKPAATPGSGDRMFESLAARPGARVLSSPATTDGPWVIVLDDFMSHDEADTLLKVGSSSGTPWTRSQAGDGVQAARTSSTSWCRGGCLRDPTVIAVQNRVEEYTGVPVNNAEYMQVECGAML